MPGVASAFSASPLLQREYKRYAYAFFTHELTHIAGCKAGLHPAICVSIYLRVAGLHPAIRLCVFLPRRMRYASAFFTHELTHLAA